MTQTESPTFTADQIAAGIDTDVLDEVIREVQLDSKVLFTWDYERSRPPLMKLYEKAKTSQWNATTDLDWSTDVDPEKVAAELGRPERQRFQTLHDVRGLAGQALGRQGVAAEFGIEMQNWLLSQFLHGEQGALLCTARIVETVPWIDAKYYAATQVMDEARHVEVFARYLDEKLGATTGSTRNLEVLLDDILADSRWDIDLPRHADHGRGARARRVRVDAPDHHRAAAEEAAALRDERRGAPRRVRRALAAGVLQGARRRGDARAPGVRVRGRGAAAATGSCSTRCGSGMGVDPKKVAARHGTDENPPASRCSSRCCSRRSCRTARSSACSTRPTAGCASASPRSASSSSRTGSTPARSTPRSTPWPLMEHQAPSAYRSAASISSLSVGCAYRSAAPIGRLRSR